MIHQDIFKLMRQEAERFYVSHFIVSPKLEGLYLESIKHVLDNNESRGVINYHSKYGQGKTFFFNVLQSALKKKYNVNIFKATSAKELIEVYKTSGETKLLEFITVKNLFIDDIGDELDGGDGMTKNFGNSMNVIKWVLLKRYEFWESKGWKTHATTNIDINKIATNYGGRVADRLTQMCNILEYDLIKTSFRQVSKVKQLSEKEKAANLARYYPVKTNKVERVNMIDFFNEIIREDKKTILNYDIYFWNIIRKYLERNKMIVYTEITDAHLNTAETLARQSIRNTTNATYKNIIVADREKKTAYDALDYTGLMLVAKNAQVRTKFLQMKNDNIKFTQNEEN